MWWGFLGPRAIFRTNLRDDDARFQISSLSIFVNAKYVPSGVGPFCPQNHYLNKFGKVPLGDAI